MCLYISSPLVVGTIFYFFSCLSFGFFQVCLRLFTALCVCVCVCARSPCVIRIISCCWWCFFLHFLHFLHSFVHIFQEKPERIKARTSFTCTKTRIDAHTSTHTWQAVCIHIFSQTFACTHTLTYSNAA